MKYVELYVINNIRLTVHHTLWYSKYVGRLSRMEEPLNILGHREGAIAPVAIPIFCGGLPRRLRPSQWPSFFGHSEACIASRENPHLIVGDCHVACGSSQWPYKHNEITPDVCPFSFCQGLFHWLNRFYHWLTSLSIVWCTSLLLIACFREQFLDFFFFLLHFIFNGIGNCICLVFLPVHWYHLFVSII